MSLPHLILTAGDPAGIGPEILLRLAEAPPENCRLSLIVEPRALEPLRGVLPELAWRRLEKDGAEDPRVSLIDPSVGAEWAERTVVPGEPSAGNAHASLAALDLGVRMVSAGEGDALVTAPLSKAEIANHVDRSFRGHTDYLAEKAGLKRYGRDYLMAFLAPNLRVALLSTHVPLHEALDLVTEQNVCDAVRCLARHSATAGVGGSIVVAALDPHAGEGGLLGTADDERIVPAVERLRSEGLDVHGPSSADSLFARAQRGAYDWVLALYHDQGLIAVKTAAFGDATNWTVGLPYLRTSVDHGTAYDIAGLGKADASSLFAVVDETLGLIAPKESS